MEAKDSVTWEEGRGSNHIHPEWTALLGVLVSCFCLVWSLLSWCCLLVGSVKRGFSRPYTSINSERDYSSLVALMTNVTISYSQRSLDIPFTNVLSTIHRWEVHLWLWWEGKRRPRRETDKLFAWFHFSGPNSQRQENRSSYGVSEQSKIKRVFV